MSNCQFYPETVHVKDDEKIAKCPDCGHLVILGLPHPDFKSPFLPVSEDTLSKMALEGT